MTGKWKGKKVAVLMGGQSKENEISLKTGNAIAKALKRKGYNVIPLEFGMGSELIARLFDERPDVAVIALHGKFGEDGCVQGLLEIISIPYTGGGVLSSAVGMDKVVCSRIARELDIPCPEEEVFESSSGMNLAEFESGLKIELPVIVKPSREGSTINMTIVKKKEELVPAIKKALKSDTKVIVEKYIFGKEVTVGVINGTVLPPLEIAPKSGFYDYASKYTKGMTEYIIPARIDSAAAERLKEWTGAIYRGIECEGTARADFIVSPDNKSYFLEINTVPGMTELSLVPKAAAHIGITFDDVCEMLLDSARLKVSA